MGPHPHMVDAQTGWESFGQNNGNRLYHFLLCLHFILSRVEDSSPTIWRVYKVWKEAVHCRGTRPVCAPDRSSLRTLRLYGGGFVSGIGSFEIWHYWSFLNGFRLVRKTMRFLSCVLCCQKCLERMIPLCFCERPVYCWPLPVLPSRGAPQLLTGSYQWGMSLQELRGLPGFVTWPFPSNAHHTPPDSVFSTFRGWQWVTR